MAYKRVTEEERTLIYRWDQEGQRQSEITRRLARNPGSISREIGRNTGLRGYRGSSYRAYAGYEDAQEWLETRVLLERAAFGADARCENLGKQLGA